MNPSKQESSNNFFVAGNAPCHVTISSTSSQFAVESIPWRLSFALLERPAQHAKQWP
jgi:hypothetical protein